MEFLAGDDYPEFSEMIKDSRKMLLMVPRVLWRTQMKDVLAETGVPPQVVDTHLLDFSKVEKYFYQCTHTECSQDFVNKVRRWVNRRSRWMPPLSDGREIKEFLLICCFAVVTNKLISNFMTINHGVWPELRKRPTKQPPSSNRREIKKSTHTYIALSWYHVRWFRIPWQSVKAFGCSEMSKAFQN